MKLPEAYKHVNCKCLWWFYLYLRKITQMDIIKNCFTCNNICFRQADNCVRLGCRPTW